MAEIALSRGLVAVVDDEDHEWLSQWKWSALKTRRPGKFYAVRSGGRGLPLIYMHRLILGCRDGEQGDHVDGDGLNNRRANLRQASHLQNCHNNSGRSRSTSRFKGVSWHRRLGKWWARIYHDDRARSLGVFDDELEAAAAYDRAAAGLFGDFAFINLERVA